MDTIPNYNKRTLRKVAKISYHTRYSAVARAEFALRAVVGFRAQRVVASYYTGVCEIGGVDLVLGATLYRLFHAY